MRRRQSRIRRWLALALALAALSFASAASAMPITQNGPGDALSYTETAAVAGGTSGGFDWADAAIGAGVALGAALGAVGIARGASTRRRQSALLHY